MEFHNFDIFENVVTFGIMSSVDANRAVLSQYPKPSLRQPRGSLSISKIYSQITQTNTLGMYICTVLNAFVVISK